MASADFSDGIVAASRPR